jgi:hypothetical protein
MFKVFELSFAVSFGLAPAVCTAIVPEMSLVPKWPLKSSAVMVVPDTCSNAANR